MFCKASVNVLGCFFRSFFESGLGFLFLSVSSFCLSGEFLARDGGLIREQLSFGGKEAV